MSAQLKLSTWKKTDLAVHFSSATDQWATPQALFDEIAQEFNFETDVCALPSSAKCKNYFTPEDDGLSQEWRGVCWMNPPYGREIGRWMKKAYESSQAGATVVCLVPARTDTEWWWQYARHGLIRIIKGRLKFGDAKSSAPFPSALVIFSPDHAAGVEHWEQQNKVTRLTVTTEGEF